MNKIKIIFIGTNEIGAPLLEALQQKSDLFEISLVITGSDKPAGRKLELKPSEIKKTAEILGIEVFQPENLNDEAAVKKLKDLKPDILLVFAYGKILSQEVLDIPTMGCLNVHGSLLPKYRGASPIQAALLNQEKVTGLSLMKMVLKMDAGPVYQKFELPIGDEDSAEELSEKLAILAAKLIPEALVKVTEGAEVEDQDEKKATYCHKISKSDGQIDWNEPADMILAKIRAYTPWPGTFTFFEGKRLKILKAKVQRTSTTDRSGLVTENGIVSKKGLIQPIEVQAEGSTVQSLEDFVNGHPKFMGSILA